MFIINPRSDAERIDRAMRELNKAEGGKIALIDSHHALMRSRTDVYTLVNDDGDNVSYNGGSMSESDLRSRIVNKYTKWVKNSR